MTGGAVVLVYHLSGYPGPLNLTASELVGIYLGTITKWNDTTLVQNNPGLAAFNVGITAVHRADPAGMTYVLTNYLSDWNSTWRNDPSLGTSIAPTWPTFAGADGPSGNSALLSAVKSTNGAIGYTDLYDAEVKALAIGSVVNSHDVPIYPSYADTKSAIADVYAAISGSLPPPTGDWSAVSWVNASGATDYPLATLVYLLVPQDPANGHTASATDATVLRQWIDWVVTSGQSYNTTEFPFVGPPGALLTQDVSALPGMTFDGAAFPSCS